MKGRHLRQNQLRLISLSLILALTSACKTSELKTKFPYTKKEFKNGVTAILIEDHDAPVVSYQTWIRVGSVDEQPGKTGLAHLFEHLMFPKEFLQKLESRGFEVNAMTTRDYTMFYENFHPKYIDEVIGLEVDRFRQLRLDAASFQNEKLVVLEERRMRIENSPEGKMQEALWALAFKAHPYRFPTSGSPLDLFAMSERDLQDFYAHHYQGGNLTVVVSGDFKTAQVLPKLEIAYAGIPAGRPSRVIPAPEPEQAAERILELHDQVASQEFAIAYPISAGSRSDSYALDVLASILFAGRSSRVFKQLVETDQILLAISGVAFTPLYPGLFLVNGTMRGKFEAWQGEKEIQKIVRQVQESGVTDDEVATAIRRLSLQVLDELRSPFGVGQLFGLVETFFRDPELFYRDIEKYQKITAADVKRVAEKYLQSQKRNVLRLIPGREP